MFSWLTPGYKAAKYLLEEIRITVKKVALRRVVIGVLHQHPHDGRDAQSVPRDL